MATTGNQKIFTDRAAAISRCRELGRGWVVIESLREPGKWYVENGVFMLRTFERVIYPPEQRR